MSISFRKLDLTLSADKQTVLVFGQEFSTKYFTEVIVVTMLNSIGSDEAKSNAILNRIHEVGLDAYDYGKYSEWWEYSSREAREREAQKRRDAQRQEERMKAIMATPEEIRKEAAERREREAQMVQLHRHQGCEFGL